MRLPSGFWKVEIQKVQKQILKSNDDGNDDDDDNDYNADHNLNNDD